MKNMTLKKIAEAVGGVLCTEYMPPHINADQTQAVQVVLDSRKVEQGYVFIATRGERVDGHNFIDAVFDAGAIGVICEKAPENPKGAYIVVKDSFQALKDLAKYYRAQLAIKVVGITGSVGKTSTKEFVASVLSEKYAVLKTEGNYNNEIGLPLTVLRIQEDCEVAVLEMGISDFGEMHRLSEIAKPDVCLITNIGQCHLENLGTRDGILKAKSEIFDFMKKDAKICLNGDDDKLASIREVKGIFPVFFGTTEHSQIYAAEYENRGLEGSSAKMSVRMEQRTEDFRVQIPLPGEHMIRNALAAAAVGVLFALSVEQIQAGISKVEPVGGRSHVIRTDTLTLLDDCYNANPVSMKSAIDLLSMTECVPRRRKVAIFGDMFELGGDEAALHYEVGAYAAKKDLDVIICVGELCRSMVEGAQQSKDYQGSIHYFQDKTKLLAALENLIKDGDMILVKASHSMHFEEVIDTLVRSGRST